MKHHRPKSSHGHRSATQSNTRMPRGASDYANDILDFSFADNATATVKATETINRITSPNGTTRVNATRIVERTVARNPRPRDNPRLKAPALKSVYERQGRRNQINQRVSPLQKASRMQDATRRSDRKLESPIGSSLWNGVSRSVNGVSRTVNGVSRTVMKVISPTRKGTEEPPDHDDLEDNIVEEVKPSLNTRIPRKKPWQNGSHGEEGNLSLEKSMPRKKRRNNSSMFESLASVGANSDPRNETIDLSRDTDNAEGDFHVPDSPDDQVEEGFASPPSQDTTALSDTPEKTPEFLKQVITEPLDELNACALPNEPSSEKKPTKKTGSMAARRRPPPSPPLTQNIRKDREDTGRQTQPRKAPLNAKKSLKCPNAKRKAPMRLVGSVRNDETIRGKVRKQKKEPHDRKTVELHHDRDDDVSASFENDTSNKGFISKRKDSSDSCSSPYFNTPESCSLRHPQRSKSNADIPVPTFENVPSGEDNTIPLRDIVEKIAEDPADLPPASQKTTSSSSTFSSGGTLALSKRNGRGTKTYGSRGKKQGNLIKPGCTFFRESTTPEQHLPRRSARTGSASSGSVWNGSDPSPVTRRTKTKKSAKTPEMIELMSDSEVEEVEAVMDEGTHEIACTLGRIAIGKKIWAQDCTAVLDSTIHTLRLEYATMSGIQKKVDIPLVDNTVICRFYQVETLHSAATDRENEATKMLHLPLISIEVEDVEGTDLAGYNSFRPNGTDPICKYVILEFQDDEEMMAMAGGLTDLDVTSNEFFEANDLPRYGACLLQDSTRKAQRRRSPRRFYKDHDEDFLLLVYPFAGNPELIESAAEGLNEASGLFSMIEEENPVAERGPREDVDLPRETSNEEKSGLSSEEDGKKNSEPEEAPVKSRQRATFVSLRVRDLLRLEPREWLNDSLVDFWMQWISRDDTSLHSNFHFFSSHFFSSLARDGPEAVQSWTARKKINIFEKRLIFIPINKSFHWSLCVVVNPGAIGAALDSEVPPSEDDPLSCLIFLDSLKMHQKKIVAREVRKWLNLEWKRLKTDSSNDKPFTPKSLRVFTPTVPYQNNSYDCGVFVCRYAYALYQLRSRIITRGDAGLSQGSDDSPNEKNSANKSKLAFYHLITDGTEFNFDMSDITRFRTEFQTLIHRLSGVYKPWKEAEDNKKRKAKIKIGSAQLGPSSEKDSKKQALSNEEGVDRRRPDGKENIASSGADEGSSTERLTNEFEKTEMSESQGCEERKVDPTEVIV